MGQDVVVQRVKRRVVCGGEDGKRRKKRERMTSASFEKQRVKVRA